MICRFFSSMARQPPIQVTNNAWNKIETIVNKSSNNMGFLFSVSSGGLLTAGQKPYKTI